MELQGKNVVVTGGASGLGRAIVGKLLAKGALVTVFDIDAEGLIALRARLNNVHCVECDVSDFDQVLSAFSRYHQEHGSAHVLINNAGVLFSAPLVRIAQGGIERHDVNAWQKVLNTDLNSVFYMTVCAVEKMIATRTKGVIVNISSISAAGNTGQSAYSAAKAGVNALTATWAKELGLMGIRVVGVAPGYVDTESTHKALSDASLQEVIRKIPLRRLGRPEEIAEGVVTVLENDFFNGKVFELDGGLVV